jgi:hypothetical protein
MKRLLTLGTAVVLVLTACAGATSVTRVNDASAHVRAASVKAIAAERRREAGREAESLLRRVVLPRGARLTHEPAGVDVLSRSALGTSVLTEFAERHGFWRVQAPLSTVVAFVKRHALPRFDQASSSQSVGTERPLYRSLDYYGPLVRGRPVQRLFTVTAVALHGSTVVRVDAGAAWIYPRSPREVVPAGVREIDIRDGHVARRVTDPAKVARIVRWFDALDVVQPGSAYVRCAAILVSRATFVFRSATGAKLASAVVPSEPADGCDAITFSIRGHLQTPLIDGVFGRRAFVNRVQRLLGVRFPRR